MFSHSPYLHSFTFLQFKIQSLFSVYLNSTLISFFNLNHTTNLCIIREFLNHAHCIEVEQCVVFFDVIWALIIFVLRCPFETFLTSVFLSECPGPTFSAICPMSRTTTGHQYYRLTPAEGSGCRDSVHFVHLLPIVLLVPSPGAGGDSSFAFTYTGACFWLFMLVKLNRINKWEKCSLCRLC